MPKRHDIQSILIVGAGPIVIGQACEFDYSGTQACQALKEEGYRIILVNSNPATIMTDTSMSDRTYIEPITVEVIEKIIQKEKPSAILPTMGGQTALNVSMELDRQGILKRYNVEMLGVLPQSILNAEDRLLFKKLVEEAGYKCLNSKIASNIEEAKDAIDHIGLPVILRPSFTLGGAGGGIIYNRLEILDKVSSALVSSPIGQILIEESALGWKEYEMEVVQDCKKNTIIICSIENVDPMGVHTGDSITVAPSLTLTDKEYQKMRDAAISVLKKLDITAGGANVQFSVRPNDGYMVVIEANPRVSRSSALASKATGFPIAFIAAKLAVGYTLDELKNDITSGDSVIPASFEPSIDYVVTKIPRFAFEKFRDSDTTLTTSMRSIGEVMAIGRTFQESFQKAIRSLENDLCGLDVSYEFANEDICREHNDNDVDVDEINSPHFVRAALARPQPMRPLLIAQALRLGISKKDIHQLCRYDPWYIDQIEELVEFEKIIKQSPPSTRNEWYSVKARGFSDKRLATLMQMTEEEIRKTRWALDVHPSFKKVDSCAGAFESSTPYMYSTYHGQSAMGRFCESNPTKDKKVVIIGSGPNRIGQGIEFDYCCTHAARHLSRRHCVQSIMINSNPETVSTDCHTADRLYFEPLTLEDVLEIVKKEEEVGQFLGVIVQFGGGTSLKLSQELRAQTLMSVPILGTNAQSIDMAEDRYKFNQLLDDLNMPHPKGEIASSLNEGIEKARDIGFPVMVRPSYVLGGRAMFIAYDERDFIDYVRESFQEGWALHSNKSHFPQLLVDCYLDGAIEIDVDVLCDGTDAFVCGIMEHIEEAGVHSGDSTCSLPPFTLSLAVQELICKESIKLAKALCIKGLMNVQYAIKDHVLYVIEANPRASRTVPFVSKCMGEQIVGHAVDIMMGRLIKDLDFQPSSIQHFAVKEVVFPFQRFPASDVLLGPEMRSTGEVMGIDKTFMDAYFKSQLAAGTYIPFSGTAFFSVRDSDKPKIVDSARRLSLHGFTIVATHKTAQFLEKNGVQACRINKVREGRPHIVDAIKNREIDIVFNTTEGRQSIKDSKSLRQAAEMYNIPYHTTLAGSLIMVDTIVHMKSKEINVLPLQEYNVNASYKKEEIL